jgi:hypothetical protein
MSIHKTLILLTLILICAAKSNYAQTQFQEGYKKGFPEGYCHKKAIGCIAPIAPIAPNPRSNESFNSFNDGYLRGFEDGLDYSNNVNTTNPNFYNVPPTEFGDIKPYNPNENDINQVYQKAQERASQNSNSKSQNTSDNFADSFTTEMKLRFQNWANKESIAARKVKYDNYMSAFNSFKLFPKTIEDGIYKCIIILSTPDKFESIYDYVDDADVIVQNNKIVSYTYYDEKLGARMTLFSRDYFPEENIIDHNEIIPNNDIKDGFSFVIEKFFDRIDNQIKYTSQRVYFYQHIKKYNESQQLLQKVLSKYETSKNTGGIKDGWHEAYLTDRSGICSKVDAFVENGKLTKILTLKGTEYTLSLPATINNRFAKGTIVRPPALPQYKNLSLSKSKTVLYDFYFVNLE